MARNLIQGTIPREWQKSKVIMIFKRGKDHEKMKGWLPINLINCIGKQEENVVADVFQGCALLHKYQFESVKGRSTTETALRTVTSVQQCLAKGRAVGWGFWDVKGSFQNVREEDVIRELEKSEEAKKWILWVRGFFRARSFELEWDGKKRRKGKTNLRALQGSPLTPIIFLIWIASIVTKMDIAIREIASYDNKLPSYIDNLHVNIYNWNWIHVNMDLLLKSINEVVNRVAKENHLPLEESKHETLVLRKKRRKKNKHMKWVT